LLDGAGGCDEFADFADVEGVVVAFGFGVGVGCVGVFPGLWGWWAVSRANV